MATADFPTGNPEYQPMAYPPAQFPPGQFPPGTLSVPGNAMSRPPSSGLRIATAIVLGLVMFGALVVHAEPLSILLTKGNDPDGVMNWWSTGFIMAMAMLGIGLARIVLTKPTATVPVVTVMAILEVLDSAAEGEWSAFGGWNPIAGAWPYQLGSALLMLLLVAAGVLTIIYNVQFRPSVRPAWVWVGVAFGIFQLINAFKFSISALHWIALMDAVSLMRWAVALGATIAWSAYLAALVNPGEVLKPPMRRTVAIVAVAAACLIEVISWMLIGSLEWLIMANFPHVIATVLAVVAVFPASTTAWLNGQWRPGLTPAPMGMAASSTMDYAMLPQGQPMPATPGAPGMAAASNVRYIGSTDPRTISPSLPSGSDTFWLSVFLGLFGYFSASNNKQTALRAGISTDYYTHKWIKGWLVGVGVASVATIVFYLILFLMLASAYR